MTDRAPSSPRRRLLRGRRRDMCLVIAGVLVSPYLASIYSWTRSPVPLLHGRLPPCPDSANCVCSVPTYMIDPQHNIAPIGFVDDADAAWARLQRILADFPGCRVVEKSDDYMRAECSTRWLRFVDDVEFQLNRDGQWIDVRSASRVGYTDFGVNRRRVEALRRAFDEAQDSAVK